jgi:hypothetical protein
MPANGLSTVNHSRRSFLTRASQWSAMLAAYPLIPLPDLAESLAADSRLAQAPVVDKGFASVRQVGEGLYATISNTSKGLQTMCNGGFLAGKDAALLLEGFVSPAGAAFQHETLPRSARPRGPGRDRHALSFRPQHGKFILRSERDRSLGSRQHFPTNL